MFFKEYRIKRKYNKANKIMEERGVMKKVEQYATLMRLGKENEANRIRKKAEEEIKKVLKEIGMKDSELIVIQNNIINKNGNIINDCK